MQRVIDAMAVDKLNVLHLHLVDAQSFALIIDSLGSTVDSFSPEFRLSFTAQQLKDLVTYAKRRGVRIGTIDITY